MMRSFSKLLQKRVEAYLKRIRYGTDKSKKVRKKALRNVIIRYPDLFDEDAVTWAYNELQREKGR